MCLVELSEIPYDAMHQTVITVMKERGRFMPEHGTVLALIGRWYQKWLSSGISELVLKVPFYRKDILSSLIEYQYWMDLLLKIMATEPANDKSGHALFDIRAYRAANRYQRKSTDFMIGYLRSDHKMHRFDKDICISADRFLPLFCTEQIMGRTALIADVFELLTVLGRGNVIPHAVKFDLERDLTLFVKQTAHDMEERAFARILCTEDFRDDHNKRDVVLDGLADVDLQRCVVFTYPYHVDISATVINDFRGRSKIFRIALSNRFAHGEVEDNDLMLTRWEIGLKKEEDIVKVVERFSILETDPSPELISGLRSLRSDWKLLKFNVFTNPFPVKWFLCIHHGHTIDFWKDQLKKHHPEISGQLLTESFDIIERIYELNWIDRFLPTDVHGTLILPKSAFHPEMILSLKERLIDRFEKVVFSDEIDRVLIEGGRVYLLDSFNIILLNNITLGDDPENFQVIVPDFLFFTYQPFIRYLALKYHFDALTGGLRTQLDEQYPANFAYWSSLSETTLATCRKDLRQFNKKASVSDNEEQLDEQPEIITDLSAAELIERVAAKERKSFERALPGHIDISTGKRKLSLRPNTPVLIDQNGTLIRTIAGVLDEGTLFVPIDDVIRNMDLNKLIDRLVTLSDSSRNWHKNLKALEIHDANIFDRLKNQGLSISKQTFEKDYLISDEGSGELHMPRAKHDWMIICERLQITDSHTAWNAIKCRGEINLLKATYARIIELMTDTGSFGINVSDGVLDQITAMLSVLPDQGLNAAENKKDAIALINEICSKINLEKIEHINNITE